MKAYIAASLSRSNDQRAVVAALQAIGIEQTFDWTRNGTLGGTRAMADVAIDEVRAVADADFIVALLPAGRGTHIEIGLALANNNNNNKTIFLLAEKESDLLGADTYTCVFYHHSLVTIVYGGIRDLVTVIEKRRALAEWS